ncbi:MAG: DUF4352 domain-containing protein [Corynebacterium sp.]|nr:DUF4352 domain-containing protein [Corynebacterium sp.]
MTDQNQYAQHPQQQPFQQPPPEKKPFYKRAWFIILVIIVVVIVLANALSGGDDDASSDSNDSSTSQDAQGNGEGNDEGTDDSGDADGEAGPAQVGDTVSTDKADITASNLRATTDALGSQYLCVDVNFQVTGDDSVSLNGAMDWKLTDPNGVTQSQTFSTEADYDSVEVGPGGSYAGVVCFDGTGEPGDYRLNFEEAMSFMNSAEAEWTTTL